MSRVLQTYAIFGRVRSTKILNCSYYEVCSETADAFAQS